MAAPIAPRAVAPRPVSPLRACFKSWSMSSFVPILLVRELTGRGSKQTRYTGQDRPSGFAYSHLPSYAELLVYRAGTSRYRPRVRHRPSPRSLKPETLHVPVRTAYLEIAMGGNAQIQCQTRLRIRNTPGQWRKVHLPDMLAVEIGPLLSLLGPVLVTEPEHL